MPLEQGHVPEQLVLPREAGPAGALPLGVTTVLHMAPQISQHREVLLVAPVARVHLRAVAPLEVILHADDRLERPELPVRLIPIAPAEVKLTTIRTDS